MTKNKTKLGLIDARIYKYWQALYMSFYSRRLYVDVAKRWKGFGLMYCLLLMTVASIPFAVKSVIDFNQYVGSDFIKPVSEIPPFKIVHGKAVFEENMPFIIKNSLAQDVVVIDTTGKINSMNEKYPDLIMLITADKYYFRAPKLRFLKDDLKNQRYFDTQRIESFDFSNIESGVFDAKAWIKDSNLMRLKNGLLAFIYPFLVSAFFGIFVTFLLVLSMMGQLVSYTIFKYKLKFKPACRIMMVSSSVGLSLFLCLKATQYNTNLMNCMCILLIIGYFCFAVLSVRRESRELVIN